ncbi:MAG: SAM-dependent methyltransferase [Paracoccaceae bacterium]|jgi:SAM-dependent methyltransferase
MQNLTDRTQLARNRLRATRGGIADFLHRIAADELHERRKEVNRPFTDVSVISGFPTLWNQLWPDADQTGDTDTLTIAPASRDLIVHAMALHWADDPIGQLVQARRGLRPDGLFLGCLFGGQTLKELRAVLAATEARITGGLAPRIAPMADIRDLGAALQRAKFAMPVADSLPLTVAYDSALHLMRDLRAMGEGNALAARHAQPVRRAVFMQAAEAYSQAHKQDDGRVTATFELIFLAGWAPSDDQPKPLRPGSATTRLAEALGTLEAPLSEGRDISND